jgi:ribosomal peptide maturation radical SAM protein 1
VYKILLVNVPFARLGMPSIALAQLKSVITTHFPGQVSIDIVDLNQDLAQYIGVDRYETISNSNTALYAGFGDWFFRAVAFPDLPDNTEAYLRRFYWGRTPEIVQTKELVATRRPVLDAYLDDVLTRHGLDRADMVGFTSMFMQNVACFALARRLKLRNPAIVTVMGGANCEFPMGPVIAAHVKQIDYVFSGPALKSFPQFVEYQMRGDRQACASIGGLFSSADGGTLAPPSRLGEELDIDTPVDLDYDDFLNRFEATFPGATVKPVVPVETSRGCWWGQRAHCTFCGLNGVTMAYRAMKPDLASHQIGKLFRYRGRASTILAVDNILPKSYLQDVLPQLDTPPDMELFYEVKADLSKKDMRILAKARALLIQPGIESLATSTLKLMKKGTTALQNVMFLKNCTTTGIKPLWNLLVGFPGERAEVYRRYMQVLPILVHLPPPHGVFGVRFDRFSPYHTHAESYGLELRPMDFYTWVYPFNEPDMQNFAYYFSDAHSRADYFTEMTDWIQPMERLVEKWRARWRVTPANTQPPRLHFTDAASDVIYDSRFGAPEEYSIGPLGKALLTELAGPAQRDHVTRKFAAEHGIDASETLTMLSERRLLFQEGDRLVSLVLGVEDSQEEEVSGYVETGDAHKTVTSARVFAMKLADQPHASGCNEHASQPATTLAVER